MTTVSAVVREIIRNRSFLEDALARNIINYNSLAMELEEEIKKKLHPKQVKLTSISMALRRIGEKYRLNYDHKIDAKLREFTDSETTIKYDLFEITIKLTSMVNISKLISDIYSKIDTDISDFLSIIKGRTEITIITHIKYREIIKKICQHFIIKNETYDLAALSLNIPSDSLITPGLFYYFTKALTLEGINISELVSTFSEMQFILDEQVVNDASRVIRNMIKNTKQ